MPADNSITVKRYEENTFRGVIHHDILARHCILDNGHHALGLDYTTAPDLGSLSQLPVELQQQIILQMGIAAVLAWRGVNKRATDLVSNMNEWKEIIAVAPNALRMAIGLRSQSTSSLADLHTALHRRTYDILHCTSGTMQYIDLKTLKRLCRKRFPYHAGDIKFEIELALGYIVELYMPELLGGATSHAIERREAVEKDDRPFKVAVAERRAFVYVGAL
ncbi:hypothetical protein BKA58DRAFT_94148 [Alternaria rosae]|uniref:uncharacterized protein n=1 Tax=Alternaria rosae TaxID=1187941 RepID=UPI001E8EA347|nr:uncharacterized protein BKA58DRAFT_94148 [Alternaria rosae]KAH6878375.1 hypothetical protein BKA58DRAFT_94148 [Alternaria rosae]